MPEKLADSQLVQNLRPRDGDLSTSGELGAINVSTTPRQVNAVPEGASLLVLSEEPASRFRKSPLPDSMLV